MSVKKKMDLLLREKGLERFADSAVSKIKSEKYLAAESRGNGGTKRFAHVTYPIAANAGDTVLSQCVRRTYETAFDVDSWELIPVKESVTGQTIERINRCDGLIIGGGGLFLPDTNQNAVSGWQWAVSSDLLKKIEVPLIIYSVGYNYFRGQSTNALFEKSLGEIIEKAAFAGLRNHGSIEAVRALLPAEISGKPVYQPCATTVIRKLYPELPRKNRTKNVAVNVAFDREELRYGDDRDAILTQIARGIGSVQKAGYSIYCVCHCRDDDRFTAYLRKEGVKYTLVDLSRRYPPDVYAFYENMEAVIGMRGHAQMIPFGLNKKILSLGSHDKMKWFLEDIGAEDWYIDVHCDDLAGVLEDRFQKICIEDRDVTEQRLMDEQERLWYITCTNLADIKSCIGKH